MSAGLPRPSYDAVHRGVAGLTSSRAQRTCSCSGWIPSARSAGARAELEPPALRYGESAWGILRRLRPWEPQCVTKAAVMGRTCSHVVSEQGGQDEL